MDERETQHVLFEDCLKVTEKAEKSIVELLAMPEAAAVDFEPPHLNREMYRAADLS